MSADLGTGRVGDRFPTNAQMLEMVRAGNPIHLAIPGNPRVVFFVERAGTRIGLELPPGDLPADIRPYRAIEVAGGGDSASVRISSTRQSLYPEFMRLLAGVAERVQIGGYPPGPAIRDALEAWREILQRDRALALEREIGLLGEIWALWRLVQGGLAPADAVSAWRGSDSEEHDFGLQGEDVEVKSTSAEVRTHIISGLTQLLPTGARPLWVLSIQFTSGGDGGHSLGQFIDLVRHAIVPADASTLAEFDRKVSSVSGEQDDQSGRRWRLRSSPRMIPVDADFPRLTPDLLGPLRESVRAHIEEVWYRITVDGMGFPDGSPEFDRVLGARPREESPWN